MRLDDTYLRRRNSRVNIVYDDAVLSSSSLFHFRRECAKADDLIVIPLVAMYRHTYYLEHVITVRLAHARNSECENREREREKWEIT